MALVSVNEYVPDGDSLGLGTVTVLGAGAGELEPHPADAAMDPSATQHVSATAHARIVLLPGLFAVVDRLARRQVPMMNCVKRCATFATIS